jgi:hypothetical protein
MEVDEKLTQLRNAGLVQDDPPLPDEYYRFIESLSEEEIDALVSIQEKIVAAGLEPRTLTSKSLVPIL